MGGSAGLQGASGLTSIERTAYPQFRRLVSARVLHVFFTPTEDEAAWARERAETPESLLALQALGDVLGGTEAGAELSG